MQRRDKQFYWLLGIGGVLVLVGAVIGGCWMPIYEAIVRRQMVLTPTSTSYDIWKDIPLPIYMEFHLFNCTNAAEVERDGNVVPELVEMGPYVFREYHVRVNMTWNSANDTITYQQVRTWQFQPDRSNGSLDDNITNFNVIATTTAYGTRYLPWFMRIFISKFIDKAGSQLFVTHTAGELLFDGYDDKLLDLALQLNTSLFQIPFKKFAYFAERNGSAEYDGWFTMHTGARDLRQLGLLTRWNFHEHTGFYGSPCDLVRGSSGELWPPVDDYRDAEIFAPDVCTTLPLAYKRRTSALGVPGLEYEGTARTFDNGSLYPDTRCQCLGECVPTGALNVSLCRFNAPLFVSYPHFYLSDPSFRQLVRGMRPDPKLHTLQFALNTQTGIPLYANARLQISIMVENFPNIRMFEPFKQRRFVPMMWFNQRVELTEHLAGLVNMLLVLPQAGAGVFFGLAGVGALLMLAAVLLRMRGGVCSSDASDRHQLLDDDGRETCAGVTNRTASEFDEDDDAPAITRVGV